MPTIATKDECLTIINVFTVDPKDQAELVRILVDVTESAVRLMEGFISASFHLSLDGTKVAAYAQWRSEEHYQAMRKSSAALPIMQRVLALATFDGNLYEVVRTFDAEE